MKVALIILACAVASSYSATFDLDWFIPYAGPAELCVAPGDIVNFNYQENHNVEATTKEAFDGCVVGNNQPVNGPIAWTAPNEEGMTYVICGVSLHCELGNQKIAIQVSNSC